MLASLFHSLRTYQWALVSPLLRERDSRVQRAVDFLGCCLLANNLQFLGLTPLAHFPGSGLEVCTLSPLCQ